MKSKKIISALLVCVMIFALLPFAAIPASAVDALVSSVNFTRATSTVGTLTVNAVRSGTFYYLINTSMVQPNKSAMSSSLVINPDANTLSNITVYSSAFRIWYYTVDNIAGESTIQFIDVSAYNGTSGIPSVTLSLYRLSQTEGVLYITSDSSGKFYYAVGASQTVPSTGNPTTIAAGTQPIQISGLPLTATKIWYMTSDGSQTNYSGVSSINVAAYSGTTDTTAPVISSLSVNRTNSTTLSVSVDVNEPCYFYYLPANNYTTIGYSRVELSPGPNSFNITGVNTSILYLFNYAADYSGNETTIGMTLIGSSSTAAPVISNVSLITLSTDYAVFTFTSSEAGYIRVAASTSTSATKSSLSFAQLTMSANSNSLTLPTAWFTSANVRLYYYAVDAEGHESSLSSVTQNSAASAGAPTLTSVSATTNSSGSTLGTFVYISDKAGFIYYAVSTSTSATKSSLTFYGAPISAGTGSFTISSAALSTTDARVYYYTMDSYNNESALSYVTVNSGSSAGSAPTLSNVSAVTTSSSSSTGTFSFTSNKAGSIYYAVSTSTNATIPTLSFVGPVSISSGSNSISISNTMLATAGARVYYVTIDTYGNQSALGYVTVNSGSSSSSAPTLSNVLAFTGSSSTSTGTFSFTSNKAGSIYYAVSTSTNATIPTLQFTGPVSISSGSNSINISNMTLSTAGARVYYVTIDTAGNQSALGYVIVNGGSSSTSVPALSNVSAVTNLGSSTAGVFTFTSDKVGYIYYAVSTSTNATIPTLQFTGPVSISSGSNSISISNPTLATAGARVYYVTTDASYNQSSLGYVIVNGGSSSTSAPTLSNVSVTASSSSTNAGIFTFTSNKAGSIYYAVSTNTNATINSLSFVGPVQISSGSNSINISSATLAATGARVYYVTTDTSGNQSSLLYATLSSAKITAVRITNITEPKAGNTPDITGTAGGSTYSIDSIVWQPVTTKFANGGTYTVIVTLLAADGYAFGDTHSMDMTINSLKATPISVSKDGSTLVVSLTYTLEKTTDNNSDWDNPFADVPDSSYYYIYIKYCFLNNLFYGTSDATFSPTATMNRAMFVTVLGRLAGVDVSSYSTNAFTDVVTNSWYAPYVAWAVKNGIVLGYGENKFGPNDPVTREQMCVFLLRYAKYAGITLGYSQKSTYGFTDASLITSWAKEAVSIFEQAGVAVSKPGATKFEPTTNAVRQEIAQILILFMMKYMNG